MFIFKVLGAKSVLAELSQIQNDSIITRFSIKRFNFNFILFF